MIPREDLFGCALAIVSIWQTFAFAALVFWTLDNRAVSRSLIRIAFVFALILTSFVVVGFTWPVLL